IATVSLGGWLSGKSGPGGWSATPRPSTPSAAQAWRARVGPRSGPPCFLLPPTMVGAMAQARPAQASAPGQPPEAIRSRSVSPTVGGRRDEGAGQLNAPTMGAGWRPARTGAAAEAL